ncbi:MAG: TonB-dependent receptor [Acidobacteriaceae bacterium]
MNPGLSPKICGKRPRALLRTMAAVIVALLPSLLHAQSLDYGALEQLFREPVTTSVDGSPQRVGDVPATMEIITAEDIRRSGAKDIPGVLRHAGGVDTLEWGNDNIDVSVRGYDQAVSARLLVLVDGRQVYTDDYGYTPWSSVPVELGMIRQIEIVKGPNSALFGFNAAGGVINIVTYNPLYDTVNTAAASGGTQEFGAGSLVTTHHFGSRAAVRLAVGGNFDGDFSTPIPPPDDITTRTNEYRSSVNLDGVIRIHEKMELDLEASYSKTQLNEFEPSYELANSRHGIASLKGKFTAETRFGLLAATLYTNRSQFNSAPGFLGQLFHLKNQVTVAELQDIFRLGAHHTLRAAAEDRYTSEKTSPTTGADVHDRIFALSGTWEWVITPTVSLTNALRVDRLSLGRKGYIPPGYPFTNADWNRTITEPSYNTGLVWKPSDMNSFRFTSSRGAELPSLVDSGALVLTSPAYNTTGSPFLKPTIVTNYEIGWDHTIPGPRMLFRGAVFFQKSQDLRAVTGDYISSPDGPYQLPSNVGNSNAIGAELGVRFADPKGFRWSVHYRPELIGDHFVPSAQNAAAFTDYQHTTPVHLLKANLGWANNKWELDGYLHYQSATHGIQLAVTTGSLIPVASFASVDARVGYKFTNRLTWSAAGQNLSQASQRQTAGPAVERRVLGAMTFYF